MKKTQTENIKEPIISFRGREMILSEAKGLLNKLEKGLIEVQLTDKEKLEYDSVKKPIGFKNETDYLKFILAIHVTFYEREYRIEKCRKKGHHESVLGIDYSSGKTYCECTSCGHSYTRSMNQDETAHFNKLMTTPMTI